MVTSGVRGVGVARPISAVSVTASDEADRRNSKARTSTIGLGEGENLLKKLIKAKLNPFPKKKRDDDGHVRRHSADGTFFRGGETFRTSMAFRDPLSGVLDISPNPSLYLVGSTPDLMMTTLVGSTSASAILFITDSDLSEEDYWLQVREREESDVDVKLDEMVPMVALDQFEQAVVKMGKRNIAFREGVEDDCEVLLQSSSTISIGRLVDVAYARLVLASAILEEGPIWSRVGSLEDLKGLEMISMPSTKMIWLLAEAG